MTQEKLPEGFVYREGLETEEARITYRQELENQLNDWLVGNNRHTKGPIEECCPDFSCCNKEMEWSLEKKKAFVLANRHDREVMLFEQVSKVCYNAVMEVKEAEVAIKH